MSRSYHISRPTWIGREPQSLFLRVLRSLLWIWAVSAVVSLRPSEAHASHPKPVRKEETKGKTVPSATPIRRLSGTLLSKPLLRQPDPSSLDSLERREHVVRRTRPGQSLAALLSAFTLPQAERRLWARSLQRTFGVKALPTGKEVHFYFAKPSAIGIRRSSSLPQLKAVELDYSDNLILTWEKGVADIVFKQREKPYDVEIKSASAWVEESLFEDGRKAGIHPTLLSQLADIFTWDIDIQKDVRRGDSFKIIYEERSRKGKEPKTSLRILAAELISTGQKMTAIYFEKQKGQGNYYNLEGRSLARSFLRFPLEFSAITSQFTDARFHPVLKMSLPHTGVDFAAQRGTPVRAVGDGIIASAGWNGHYGKAIDVQHDSNYMSRYAHLDRLAAGIHNGAPVTKGQIIGYVGSTGRTTGPHLHFELYKDQQYIDPLSVDFPAEETIEPDLQRIFDYKKETYLVELSFSSHVLTAIPPHQF
jgi:murein DD-endopeptidase MepM/ murein hydrolase activator NlpD